MTTRVSDDWKVLEHGKIERLTERLWRVEGMIPGMSLRRVMTVVKRSSGGLAIHSAIALDEGEMAELEAWGKPDEAAKWRNDLEDAERSTQKPDPP